MAASLPLLLRVGIGCAQIAGIQAAEPLCANGKLDDGETDIDCGGVCGGKCPGANCSVGADCASGACGQDHLCESPTCTDTLANGAETDVNCGGGTCPVCAENKLCLKDSDCLTTKCTSGICVCLHCGGAAGRVIDYNTQIQVMCPGPSTLAYQAYRGCVCSDNGCKSKCNTCAQTTDLLSGECAKCATERCGAVVKACLLDKQP